MMFYYASKTWVKKSFFFKTTLHVVHRLQYAYHRMTKTTKLRNIIILRSQDTRVQYTMQRSV